jgi:hypothetical protein
MGFATNACDDKLLDINRRVENEPRAVLPRTVRLIAIMS